MRKKIVGIFICMLFIGIVIPQTGLILSVKADPGDVILSFDSPGNMPRGLAWDGTYLWNADNSNGAEKIYKLNPLDGSIVDSFNSPGTRPMGLAWDGQYLWNSDCLNHKIYKLDPSDGSIVDSFNSPGNWSYGLAWDGTYIWNVDNSDYKIYKINPLNGIVVVSIDSPGINPAGLTYDGTYLWNSDFTDIKIHKIDPSNGIILDSIDTGFGTSGLAWDGQYLWNSDLIDKKIYKIDVGSNGGESDIIIDDISGGFGLSTKIVNNGIEPVYNLNWSIYVEPKIGLVLSEGHTSGVIDELAVDESETLEFNDLRGIGLIIITLQVADAVKQATAFLLGPLVLRVKEI